MKKQYFAVIAMAALGVWSSGARATPSINVGSFNLLPDTPGQLISIPVTGGDAVTGFNLRAQLGDGTGPMSEPIFQAVGFGTGSIWDGHAISLSGGPIDGAPSDAQADVVLNSTGESVAASGTLLTLTISTIGLSDGTYPLLLKSTEIGADSAFIGQGGQDINAAIVNGSINVVPAPEPTSVDLLALAATGLLRRRWR